ncbi:nuclear pore complex protein Nup98-Nup96 isoform X1 [Cimex lectularius]|uniref:Nuclear pore complex protein Nup98-Nup96 n=1 Tax=Cimex lectularius TaxID=79782 RepID=A0A8I6RB53_CIMLE|nr:nuclear pore complex protein Nup98-Nup96 isoform X1 [Cimex lectularius]
MFQAKSSPFGQTPFGQPSTTGFSPPVFGSTPNTGLFSGATTQQSGLFGSSTATPAFGQTQTTTPAFGGFTSTSSGTGLFGNQQNVSSGLFGSSTTPAFGQPKPAFGGFGTQQTGGLFGQQPQQNPVQQTSLFGQPATQSASGLFGSSSFGAGTAAGGTTIKFVPVTGTDTMLKNGVSSTINTRHHCITCMKEYEGKSLEELRLEDYLANRKGPQQGVQPGLFGSTNQPSLFSTNTNTGTTSTSLFGGENKSLFGGTNQGFGTGMTNTFGAGTSGSALFGKPSGTVTAFATPASTTSNTFGFNTNTTTNPFGAQKPFGATTQPGLFGSTSQPTSSFGTQQTGFGTSFQNQTVQNGGIFGQNKQPFPMGTTNAFSFNQPASSGTSTSIFGNKPATSGFGTFGSTSTPGTGFTGTNFGATNQNTSFGTNFKAPGTTFNFTTPTTNTLGGGGLSLGGGSSLFGNTSKPGGLFNQPSTGLFSGCLGNTNSNFNTGSTALGGLGGTQPFSLGSGFGTGQNTNLGTQSGQMNSSINHLMVYGSSPFGDSPIFKNLLTPTGKADELIKPTSPATQKALISGQNYKISPKNNTKIKVKSVESNYLTKKSLFDGLDGEEEATNEVLGQAVRPSPKRLMFKPRSLTDISITQRSSLPGASNLINEMSPVIKTSPKVMFKTTVSSNSPADNSPHVNLMKAQSTPKSSLVTKKTDSTNFDNTIEELRSKSNTSNPQNVSSTDNKDVLSTTSSSDSEMEDTVPPEMDGTTSEHPTGIVLRRLGYYTIPSLDELAELMDNEGRCIVDNFTIGRLNYGNIFYPDSFDVAGLNLDEIVHFRHKEVVVYPDDEKKPPVGKDLNRRAQVTLDRVWPVDKTTRQPVTDPVRISLLDYERKLENVSAKHGTKFVEYRYQTGSWVFKVDHFSKYGISDSDEEELPANPQMPKIQDSQQLLIKQQQQAAKIPPSTLHFQKQLSSNLTSTAMMLGEEDDDMDDGITNPYDLDGDLETSLTLSQKYAKELRKQKELLSHESIGDKIFSPTSNLAKELGSSSHKVQLMKASFFDRGDFEIDGEFLKYEDMDQPVNFQVNGFSFDAKKLTQAYKWYRQNEMLLGDDLDPMEDKITSPSDLCRSESPLAESEDNRAVQEFSFVEDIPEIDEQISPKTYVLGQRISVLPYIKSSCSLQNSKCLVDMSIFRGRGFKVSWGPRSQLIVLSSENSNSKELYMSIDGRKTDDNSSYVLERHSLYDVNAKSADVTFEETVLQHLEVTYSQSILNDNNGNPHFTFKPGTGTLQKHFIASKKLVERLSDQKKNYVKKYLQLSCHVWGLCVALWGDLECSEDSHEGIMQRKYAVSSWLEDVLSSYSEENVIDENNTVFAYMTAHKIDKACEEAQKKGDHQLSLLLSQCQSTPEIRDMIEKQLIQWRETEADKHIDIQRLKTLMLAAALPVHRTSSQTLNACEDLNWLQAFGIHLWYINSRVASVTDALLAYENAYKNEGYASKPKPHYEDEYVIETSHEKEINDIIYHLLKLFSAKSHPLEQLLNPTTYSPEPLDYRLSWFLMRTLVELGYAHLSLYAMSLIHISFSAQLEGEGLWHWAVFVLMHINDEEMREKAVKDIISKHVSIEDNDEKEMFLMQKLNIPSEWIYEAKAILALSLKRYHASGKYFLKSHNWNQAHSVIMKHIYPKAIILSNHDYLESLLNELAIDERHKEVTNWNRSGYVVLKYLRLMKRMGDLVSSKNDDYKIGTLQIELQELFLGLKLFKRSDPLEKLSLEVMAKRTVDLALEIALSFHGVDTPAVLQFTEFMHDLPMPQEDKTGKWLTVVEFWNKAK